MTNPPISRIVISLRLHLKNVAFCRKVPSAQRCLRHKDVFGIWPIPGPSGGGLSCRVKSATIKAAWFLCHGTFHADCLQFAADRGKYHPLRKAIRQKPGRVMCGSDSYLIFAATHGSNAGMSAVLVAPGNNKDTQLILAPRGAPPQRRCIT